MTTTYTSGWWSAIFVGFWTIFSFSPFLGTALPQRKLLEIWGKFPGGILTARELELNYGKPPKLIFKFKLNMLIS